MEPSNRIKIEMDSGEPYKEVKKEEQAGVQEFPVFKRRKFDPNKISGAMLRDHCRYY